MMNRYYGVVVLTFCLVVVVVGQLCGNSMCGSGEGCCNDFVMGPTCYSPATSTCAQGKRLCGINEDVCGDICYDVDLYSCNPSNQLLQGTSLPSSPFFPPLFCSAFTLNPCQQGEECCDGDCFDPQNFVCLNNMLCPVGNGVCAEECYDLTTQECCNRQIFAKGTSVCSSSSAECCSCSCSQPITGALPSQFTISSTSQCTNQYISSTFGPVICPGQAGGCGEFCNVTCPDNNPFIFNYCFSDEPYGCTGHYLCSGGAYSCGISNAGQCHVTVTNYATNTTQVAQGTTNYSPVPATYVGEVCCWCVTGSNNYATSTPVPSVSNCTAEYVNAMEGGTSAYIECRVWSPYSPPVPQGLACGLPEA